MSRRKCTCMPIGQKTDFHAAGCPRGVKHG